MELLKNLSIKSPLVISDPLQTLQRRIVLMIFLFFWQSNRIPTGSQISRNQKENDQLYYIRFDLIKATFLSSLKNESKLPY